MDMFDFSKPEWQDFISQNMEQIVDEAVQPILDHPKFQILRNNILEKFWESRVNKNNLFVIYLKNECFDNLNLSEVKGNLENLVNGALTAKNYLEVDSDFSVIYSEQKIFDDGNEENLRQKSMNGESVFFFGPNGIDDFINGTKRGDNLFYSDETLRQYHKKKTVADLDQIFTEYKRRILGVKTCFGNFFAQKPSLKAIWGDNWKDYTHLLRNTPESWMRDDLFDYLSNQMVYYIQKENELPSGGELDIYFEAEGKLYFIEIKWLGNTLNSDGNGISGTDYSGTKAHARARYGVKQTVEYIKEVVNVLKYNVQTGYLVIFDARKNVEPIDYQDYSNVPDELKSYLQHFNKTYDDLRLVNSQPG